MGKFNDGIFGSFSGRVGNVVGANWRGIDVLRKRPRKKPNRTATANQLEHRAKFAAVVEFLNPIKEVAGAYFSRETKSKSRYNLATGFWAYCFGNVLAKSQKQKPKAKSEEHKNDSRFTTHD